MSTRRAIKTELGLVDSFAGKHGKLMAVTETGMATSTPDTGSSQTALHATGNAQLDWYSKMLDATSASGASYIMTWANWGKNSAYYTPYVDSVNADGSLHGHEMLDAFIKYYNDPRSIFAANQKSALASLPDVAAKSAAEGADGYITSPVSGSRILEGLSITANVSGASGSDNVSFICKSKDGSVTLPGKMNGSSASAELTDADLASLGEGVGTIALVISGKTVDTISGLFNMKQAEQDPHETATRSRRAAGQEQRSPEMSTGPTATRCSSIRSRMEITRRSSFRSRPMGRCTRHICRIMRRTGTLRIR